jgi:monoamine oxidase
MLEASLAGTAGLFLSERCAAAGATERKVGKRVLIIGAGFAGLSAAHELSGVGYEVTVVEARERLAGRVLSLGDFVGTKTVEAGGELIGANHPTWTAYAKHFGLELVEVLPDRDVESPLVLNGRRLDADEGRALWKEMRDALQLLNVDAVDVDPDKPWTHPQAARLDRTSTASWIEGLRVSALCKHAMTIQLTAINGMLPAWQSYLGNLAMIKGGGLEKYWTETDRFHCAGGNQRLAAKLAEGIGEARILRGTPATAVTVQEKEAIVELANGKQFEVDDVVLAAPASTWNRIAFDPPLPAELTIQVGTNTKFLAALKQRFWKGAGLSPRSLTDGPVSLTWEATSEQPGDEGICMTAFSGGPAVDRVLEWGAGAGARPGAGADDRTQNYLETLESLYPGIRKQFEFVRFINWPCDPWSKGSYSFPAPGQVTAAGPILHQGLGRLHFAGEHTCFAFIGYMEGALRSGTTLAKRFAVRDGIAK